MTKSSLEQRRHIRYSTEVAVHFHVPYDFRTEVDFGIDSGGPSWQSSKYIGFSKNISVHGLCFESNKELVTGTHLWMEVHLPSAKEIIYMQGIVRWSQLSSMTPEAPKAWLTGVEVDKVDGVDVEQTVYFDQKYNVHWSELLERVLGGFAKLHKKRPVIHVLRGIVKDNEGRYLLMQRSARSKSFPSKWEFPGGKIDVGEDELTALKREFLEETGLTVKPGDLFKELSYDKPQGRVLYKIFYARVESGTFTMSDEHDDAGWFTPEQMRELDISPPLTDVIKELV